MSATTPTFATPSSVAAITSLGPLLQPQHFVSGRVRLRPRGLTFDAYIEHARRASGSFVFHKSRARWTDGHGLAQQRQPSRCLINPHSPSAEELEAIVNAAEFDAPMVDDYAADYGLRDPYDLAWKRWEEQSTTVEGQYIVVVCLNGDQPVGYAGIDIALRRDIDECELALDVEPRHVYVVPPLRGQGFGIDLAVTCGGILIDVLDAISCACPPCWALAVSMCSEYPGAADHVFTRHVTALLNRHLRVLRKRGRLCSGDVERLVGRVDY